jgi:hypothetical protein
MKPRKISNRYPMATGTVYRCDTMPDFEYMSNLSGFYATQSYNSSKKGTEYYTTYQGAHFTYFSPDD